MMKQAKIMGDEPLRRRKTQTRSQLGRWIASVAAIASVASAATLIAGGAWIGIQLIINPDSIVWLNQYLPQWTRIPIALREPQQTIDQIRRAINEQGLIAGEILPLNTLETKGEVLLPILQEQRNCEFNCKQIVELRVYQPTEEKMSYRLISKLDIAGIEASLVIPNQNNFDSNNPRGSSLLPLTKISKFEGKIPDQGIFFNLRGQLEGRNTAAYGQIVHYNPRETYLSVMLPWTTKSGENPYWQEVTGGASAELVINQTVGFEPRYKVYQLKTREFKLNPIAFEEISLNEPALNEQSYRLALILAKNGVWSSALGLLQTLQKSESLPEEAQAQIDLIELHAQFTKLQANKAGASHTQQIITSLIDGRWENALLVFQSSDGQDRYEVANLLKKDSVSLLRRVEASLKLTPDNRNIKAWGVLILAAKQGRQKAIAWLQQLSQVKEVADKEKELDKDLVSAGTTTSINELPIESYEWVNQLVDLLELSLYDSLPTKSHLSQIVGVAQPLTELKATEWLSVETTEDGKPLPLQLEPQQIWYQVQVSSFNDGQRWRQYPFVDLAIGTVAPGKQLWKLLGLEADSRIEIALWNGNGQKQTVVAIAKAAQIKDGTLNLLVAGKIVSPKVADFQPLPLAHTQKAIQYLPINLITLSQLNQTQPQLVGTILPTLWIELQNAGQLPPGDLPNLSTMLQMMGEFAVQPIDLTGNKQPEMVLTLYKQNQGNLLWSTRKETQTIANNRPKFRPRTLIFSEFGTLIYSEFTTETQTSLAAIADVGDGGTSALIVKDINNYSLKRWLPETQRFE